DLRRHEMPRLAPHFPHTAVRLPPVVERSLDLALEHRPQPFVEPVTERRVQVRGPEHRPPHVVLALGGRTVAGTNRARSLIAVEVVESDFGQMTRPVDRVHDLE